MSDSDKLSQSSKYIDELEKVAIPAQNEVLVSIKGTEFEEKYTYDVCYDLARIHAARLVILDTINSPLSQAEFSQVVALLQQAKSKATTVQWDAALRSLKTTPAFTSLAPHRVEAIRAQIQ